MSWLQAISKHPSSAETSLIFPLANWTPPLICHTSLNCKHPKKTHDLPLKTGLHSCIPPLTQRPRYLRVSLYSSPSLYPHSQFSHQVLKGFPPKSFWNVFLLLFNFYSVPVQVFTVSQLDSSKKGPDWCN